ncbi:unnamed protein product [Phytophthora lilii]|uniref:Unnamed protein product n=1 Tax=Phytophthora lilii TaxID=2077276 RepID=A0A9W7D7E1_9STRA|nr:unnamed protein product [Phytophthora lilii]
MLDSWTYASEHYVACFACYEKDGKLVTPLLSMAPLFNEPNDDLSARAHLDFLASMLARDYGVQLEQFRFVVGDNCSLNRLLATLMQVPLVGCASHRLNRAVQEDMAQHEEDLGAVHKLMINLRTLTICQTLVRSVRDACACCYQADAVFVQGAKRRRVGVVRQWFDELIVIKPQYAHYLGKHKARDSNEHANTNVRLNAARSQGKHRPQPRLRGGLCACPSR